MCAGSAVSEWGGVEWTPGRRRGGRGGRARCGLWPLVCECTLLAAGQGLSATTPLLPAPLFQDIEDSEASDSDAEASDNLGEDEDSDVEEEAADVDGGAHHNKHILSKPPSKTDQNPLSKTDQKNQKNKSNKDSLKRLVDSMSKTSVAPVSHKGIHYCIMFPYN